MSFCAAHKTQLCAFWAAQSAALPLDDSDKMVSELLKFIPAMVNVLTSP